MKRDQTLTTTRQAHKEGNGPIVRWRKNKQAAAHHANSAAAEAREVAHNTKRTARSKTKKGKNEPKIQIETQQS
jgi:hypothetical protein